MAKKVRPYVHSGWYHPPSVGYVYLTSLLSDPNPRAHPEAAQLYYIAEDLYNLDGEIQYESNAMGKYKAAINLLYAAAATEQKKEIAFVQGQIKKHPELFKLPENKDITADALIQDPMLLENLINQALLGYDQALRQVKELKNNADIRKNQQQKNLEANRRGSISATQAMGKTTVNNIIDAFLGRGTHGKNDLMIQLTNIVLSKGAGLLDGRAVVMLIAQLQTFAEQAAEYVGIQQFDAEKLMADKSFSLFMKKLDDIQSAIQANDQKTIQEYSDFYSNQFDYLMGKGVSTGKKRRAKIKKSKNENTGEILGLFKGKKAQKMLSHIKNDIIDIDTSVKYGLGAEVTAVNRLIADAIYNELVGGQGMKTDLIRLFDMNLKITVNESNQLINTLQNAVNQDIDASNKYLFEQQQAYNEMYSELENILQQNRNEVEGLNGKLFILHENIKDYMRLPKQGINFEGFSGGTSWTAATITNFLNNLTSVGFKAVDMEWLTTALINLNIFAAGRGSTPMMENYLAGFAIATLFSDGYTIFQQALNGANNYSPVESLHLFNTNGIYRTSSYLLNQIAGAMQKSSDDVAKNIKVTIQADNTNYYPKNIKPSLHGHARWEMVRDSALANTKVSLQILANFFEVLNQMGF